MNVAPTSGGGASTTGTADSGGGVTAQSARQFLVSMLILLVFVIVMTMVAGASPEVGKGVVAVFATLLLLQGITHVNPFVQWMEHHPLTPAP